MFKFFKGEIYRKPRLCSVIYLGVLFNISLQPLYQIEDAHQLALFLKIPEVEMQTLIPKTP